MKMGEGNNMGQSKTFWVRVQHSPPPPASSCDSVIHIAIQYVIVYHDSTDSQSVVWNVKARVVPRQIVILVLTLLMSTVLISPWSYMRGATLIPLN